MQRRPTPRRRDAPRWTPPEWADATTALLRRSKGLCECCGTPLRGRAERSHRIRREVGGDRLSNICLVLPEHHAEFHRGPALAREHGFHLSQFTEDPAKAPVFYMRRRWVLLDDDGGMTPCEPPT